MAEICVFAGTTEGRRLLERLQDQPVKVLACVATDYGEKLAPQADNIEISAGRLDEAAMTALFARRRFDVVIDATHPFATQVSAFIANACAQTQTEYLRLNRETESMNAEAVYVASIQEAADYLAAHPGRALLATGSKELKPYARVADYQERFFVRVLPMAASLEACAAAGFAPSHILAMQGPFSVEMNIATLRAVKADYLVTKDSGESGGFQNKLEAARQAGAQCIVIGRPNQQPGLSYAQVINWLANRYALKWRREVAVVGIGMGGPDTLTFEADRAFRGCDCIIGAARMLEALSHYDKPAYPAIVPEKIVECMDAHPEFVRFAVAMSGDTGFFSGTKKLLPLLAEDDVRVVSGLSSLQYLCARLRTSWDDVRVISLHGRSGSVVPALCRYGRMFVLVDGRDGVSRLCRTLCDAGMGDVYVSVGERLSYPEERITCERAENLKDRMFDALSAVLLETQAAPAPLPIGLPDEAFVRQKAEDAGRTVPMTKSEVRAVSIAKIRLARNSIVYDVGAGTGSVSVEAALLCPEGKVYAIECRADACALIDVNSARFGLQNLQVVQGFAPEALEPLPAPTHAFIGGSSGSLREIIAKLLEKNERIRIVINAIALETLSEIMDIVGDFEFDEVDMVQLGMARSRTAGRYHLMNGLNPIWIAALQRTGEAKDCED